MRLRGKSLLPLVLSAVVACTSDHDESASAPAPSRDAQPGGQAPEPPDLGRAGDAQEPAPEKQVTKPGPDARAKLTRAVTWLEGGDERRMWVSDDLVVEFEPTAEGREALLRVDPGAIEVPQRQEGVRLWSVSATAEPEDLVKDASTERARFSPVLHATDSPESPKSALPGGVLVTFPAGWDRARIDGWLAERGRSAESEVGDGLNTYLVPTAPGLAALEACEELSRADKGVTCEPNWWREPSTR